MVKKLMSIGAAAVMGACLFCGCGDDVPAGEFYSLQEAYDNGWLTREDLLSVAYYQNHSWGEEQVEYPQKLDLDTEKDLIEVYAKKKNMNTEDVRIFSYYGTYNGSYVIDIGHRDGIVTGVVWTETVGGVEINYCSGARLFVLRLES